MPNLMHLHKDKKTQTTYRGFYIEKRVAYRLNDGARLKEVYEYRSSLGYSLGTPEWCSSMDELKQRIDQHLIGLKPLAKPVLVASVTNPFGYRFDDYAYHEYTIRACRKPGGKPYCWMVLGLEKGGFVTMANAQLAIDNRSHEIDPKFKRIAFCYTLDL